MSRPASTNPCITVYGPGPQGTHCETCTLLSRRGRYFKCALRAVTRGAKTDHRARWTACGKYEPTPTQEA